MSITCTVGGVSYNITAEQFHIVDTLEVRSILTITLQDSTGTVTFQRGQPVVLTDSTLGTLYSGFVGQDLPGKAGPASAYVEHILTCYDKQYWFDKGTNSTNYYNEYAGDIAVDFVINGQPGREGVTVAANSHRDTTTADFSKGVLSGTAGYTTTTGDGDLELLKAGSDVTITEATTADFSLGTPTNVTIASNSLSPATQSAFKAVVTLPGGGSGAFLSLKIWSGTMTVGTNDTLNFDEWIASTSPDKKVSIDLLFSDGTVLSTLTNVYDQNVLLAAPATDLSNYASDKWYTRTITLTGLNGKTLTTVLVYFAGTSPGTYTAYFKNIYLGSQSGSPFLSTTATATNVSPPTVYQFAGYFPSTLSTSIVAVFNPANSSRISPAHSIDAVKLLKGSTVTWTQSAISGSSVVVSVSYDGVAFQPCTNNAALPALPVGSNVAGLNLTIKETFSVGTDPTAIPVLNSVSITLYSAPNATKSDIVTAYETQAGFNTGTYSNTTADSNGNLLLTSITRNWNDTLITNQTFFSSASTTQSAATGAYVISSPTGGGFGISRLDFAGQMIDFTIDCDLKVSGTNCEAGITYRQISWVAATNNTFGYYVGISSYSPSYVQFGHGSNSTNDNYTQTATYNTTISAGTTYHIKIVVNGTHHQIYLNNGTTPILDLIDSTYQQAGYIGLRGYNVNVATQTATFDNLVLAQASSGTWTSPSGSLASLVTCGPSCISWTETNTSTPVTAYAVVQTSIDGGSSYQICTNGGSIPNLASGTNVSSMSILTKVTLGSQTNLIPSLTGLVWRVLGVYPGSSGTRTTLPMVLDTAVRANQSGFGTATDGQSYTKVGTGTDAVSSNTLTLTNTTGDVYEIPGSRTWTDEDGSIRFQLSASTIAGGMVLRYSNTNNLYRLSISTTTLTITKKSTTFSNTLSTASVSLSTATWYRARFRVSGSGPVTLQARVWLDGTLEPTTWSITATD